MKTIIIIPARYASSRYPGKPLARLALPDGTHKTLIQLTWEAARRVQAVEAIYISTDDRRIQAAAEGFGAEVIMTSPTCANGTERCAEAVQVANLEADLIVNWQGDAPLTPEWFIDALIASMKDNQSADLATPVIRLDHLTYKHFVNDRRQGRVGGTLAVFDQSHRALYFSKELIPYMAPSKLDDQVSLPFFHHVGVYAYSLKSLCAYSGWPQGPLETLEGLEQLRFLEQGYKIQCVEVEGRGRVFWELNNPEDVTRIEQVFADNPGLLEPVQAK